MSLGLEEEICNVRYCPSPRDEQWWRAVIFLASLGNLKCPHHPLLLAHSGATARRHQRLGGVNNKRIFCCSGRTKYGSRKAQPSYSDFVSWQPNPEPFQTSGPPVSAVVRSGGRGVGGTVWGRVRRGEGWGGAAGGSVDSTSALTWVLP